MNISYIKIMKRLLEDEYKDLHDIRKEYCEKKKKLNYEYQEKMDTTFKKSIDIVNENREKYIKVVKDWMKDYIENNRGKAYCNKNHESIYSHTLSGKNKKRRCPGYNYWDITVDDEKFT